MMNEIVALLAAAKDTLATLTPASNQFFLDLVWDAPNWNGQPLLDGNVRTDAKLRGNVTDLKKKGLIETTSDEGCTWVLFTALGKAAAVVLHKAIDEDTRAILAGPTQPAEKVAEPCPEGCGGELNDEMHAGVPCRPVSPTEKVAEPVPVAPTVEAPSASVTTTQAQRSVVLGSTTFKFDTLVQRTVSYGRESVRVSVGVVGREFPSDWLSEAALERIDGALELMSVVGYGMQNARSLDEIAMHAAASVLFQQLIGEVLAQ